MEQTRACYLYRLVFLDFRRTLPNGKQPMVWNWMDIITPLADGSLEIQSRLSCKRIHSDMGVLCSEVFASVAKMNTFCIFIALGDHCYGPPTNMIS